MLIDDPYQLATSGQIAEYSALDALRYKYAALVGTDAIADPVASKLQVPVDDVLGALSTNVPMNSLLMTVEATWSTPQGAQRIAQAAANEVTAYIATEDNAYAIPTADRFTFKVIDPATPAFGQGPSKSKAATLAIGLGVLGFALGFLGTQLIRYARRR
jgi:capsular polysaccharide biosynthesis protein